MKACMLAYTYYDSDNRVRRYAEALVRGGDQVDAIALAREGQPAFEVIKGVRVYRIQKRVIDETGPVSYLLKLLLFFIRSAWVITIKHLREPYTLIHVHSVPDFEVFATVIPCILGARIILDIHDIVPELYASKFNIKSDSLIFRLLVWVERISIAYAHHVVIANQLWYERLTHRSVTPQKCTTLINYPDLSLFHRRPRPARNSDMFVMYYPGSLSWHQGLDLVIKAVALLRDRAPLP
jgi:glycosyltransferase involved in cell wall biosynthesis